MVREKAASTTRVECGGGRIEELGGKLEEKEINEQDRKKKGKKHKTEWKRGLFKKKDWNVLGRKIE